MLKIEKKGSVILLAGLLCAVMLTSACGFLKKSNTDTADTSGSGSVSEVSASSGSESTPAETPEPVKESELKTYLDRIASGGTGYTISSLEHGEMEPRNVDPAPYLDILRGEAEFEAVDGSEAPDGEYVVLTFPEDRIRFDFLPNAEGKNYIREVKDDTQETLYLAKYADASVNTNAVMTSWYQALAEASDAAEAAAKVPDSPAWVAQLPSAQDQEVTQLLVVAGDGMDSSTAAVSMHYRYEDGWKQILSVPGYIGREGMCPDEEHMEGDFTRTPIGVYRFNKAFGVADDPGCQLGYTKVGEDDYWSGDDREGIPYNQLVSIKDYPDLENSIHLVDAEQEYKYCLNISFNEEGTPGRGSAIFLRCEGEEPYTGGSVAIPEESMKTVMEMVGSNCAVVINTAEALGATADSPAEAPADAAAENPSEEAAGETAEYTAETQEVTVG